VARELSGPGFLKFVCVVTFWCPSLLDPLFGIMLQHYSRQVLSCYVRIRVGLLFLFLGAGGVALSHILIRVWKFALLPSRGFGGLDLIFCRAIG